VTIQEALQTALGDAYRVERELSPGGMSRIFLATESSLGRSVVVKVLPSELANEVSATRFRREIEIAARLQHPHILPVLTAGVSGSLLYFIMPYVTGESLRHRLSRERQLPLADALEILHEVADALAYAHASGVVHRDVKPENILLESGHAVLADFGIARALLQSTDGNLTATGLGIGTPGYMAPEQAAGERSVDARADVYALAVVGYEMIAGMPPFSGSSAHAVVMAHLSAQPRALSELRPDVPPSIAQALERAMAKLPEQRFQSAAELRDALRRPAAQSVRPRTRVMVSAGLAAVALATAAAVFVRNRAPASLDAELLAVAPFDVIDASLSLLGEGLVDVASRSLDGAGTLRTVSPSLVFRRWSGRADPLSATALGHATGAGLAVVGSVVRAGADSVRLNASVFDVAGERSMGDVQFVEAVDRIDRISDSLSVGVLRLLGRARRAGTAGFGSLGTRSLLAGKAFLRGEQYYRRAAWDSAEVAFVEAFTTDSTFALAYNRAAHARGWSANEGDPRAIDWRLRAGQLATGLSLRDSLLLLADSLRASVSRPGPPDIAESSRTKRQFALLEELTRLYGDDAEMWYDLGDAYYHGNLGPTSIPDERVLRTFERAIELDSTYAPAYPHMVDIALRLYRDTTRALRYADRYAAISTPGGVFHESLQLVASLLRQPPADSAALRARLLTVRPNVRLVALRTLARFPDRSETGARVARAIWAAATDAGAEPMTAATRSRVAEALAWRGHLDEASRAFGDRDNSVISADLFALGVTPRGTPTEILERWAGESARSQGPPYFFSLLPWMTLMRDTASINRLLQVSSQIMRTLAPEMPSVVRANALEWLRLASIAGRAHLQLARGDSTTALRQLESLPDSTCTMFCSEVPLLTAQLLMSRGRYQEAASLLAGRWAIGDRPMELVYALERGRANEHLMKREEAIEAYTLVIDAWANGDSLAQAVVRTAREGLRRLGVDENTRQPLRSGR
jgi:serine/threonine-protein kinase